METINFSVEKLYFDTCGQINACVRRKVVLLQIRLQATQLLCVDYLSSTSKVCVYVPVYVCVCMSLG